MSRRPAAGGGPGSRGRGTGPGEQDPGLRTAPAGAATTVRLAAEGVTCSYGGRPALEGFDLDLAPGTLVALLGANGAGKTTALRALARLHKLDSGRVLLDGRDAWTLPRRHFARHVAFVPQSEEVFGPVTVEEVALLGRTPHRGWLLPFGADDRRVADRVLERLGLTGLRRRTLDTLSGGEQRRAHVARALTQEAEVLLLDEPTAHLDLRHQVDLLELLVELAEDRGIAVVASFHDLNHAARYAHRAVLLADGRVLAHGPVEEVLVPDTLRRAYDLDVKVVADPATGVPTVLPVRPAPRPRAVRSPAPAPASVEEGR